MVASSHLKLGRQAGALLEDVLAAWQGSLALAKLQQRGLSPLSCRCTLHTAPQHGLSGALDPIFKNAFWQQKRDGYSGLITDVITFRKRNSSGRGIQKGFSDFDRLRSRQILFALPPKTQTDIVRLPLIQYKPAQPHASRLRAPGRPSA